MKDTTAIQEIKKYLDENLFDYPKDNELLLKSNLKNDICLDSIEVIELIIKLEKVFNKVVDDAEIKKIKTVSDLINSIEWVK